MLLRGHRYAVAQVISTYVSARTTLLPMLEPHYAKPKLENVVKLSKK